MTENPRLVALSGPLQEKEFPLADETAIGRDPVSQIHINEGWISRQHCIIRQEKDRFKIVDLGSHNGTFVNDVPVKERLLEPGDRIQIADSVFVFLLHEGDPAARSSQIQMDEGKLALRSTTQLRREDALYLHPDRMAAAKLSASTVERDLRTLLKVGNSIVPIKDVVQLQKELLAQIFEIVPAERGVILLGVEEPGVFSSELVRHRSDEPDVENEPLRVSRTILDKVQSERVAFLGNQLPDNEELAKASSLVSSRVQSVLCLPLVAGDRLTGVIYLDSRVPGARFEADNLELLTAVANIGAAALENAQSLDDLEIDNRLIKEDFGLDHSMVGESGRMREVYQFISKVAPTDSTVLVYGESGTGKELAARAIHKNSLRDKSHFVKIDCTTLTENLLENELFGHEKGAFTGAIGQKKGKLELADGGTVFLDELGELPISLQSKLLRVLQDREFDRVGGVRPIPVDIRLIAATNKNLAEEMKEGKFREDLYYRLNVISVTLPPLRERREDIPLLANYFVAKYSKRVKRRVRGISSKATAYLKNYDWPGNVRELENTIERGIVLGSTDTILPEDLAEDVLEAKPSAVPTSDTAAGSSYHDTLAEAKKQLILDAVKNTGGSYTEAAKQLGLHPNYLHRLIRNLDIKEDLKKLS